MAVKVTHGLIDLLAAASKPDAPLDCKSSHSPPMCGAPSAAVDAALARLLTCSVGRERDALRDVDEAERLSRCVAIRIREEDVDGYKAHSELIISVAESHLVQ